LNGKVAAPGLENREYGLGIRCADHATPSIGKKLALTSPTSGGRSVAIVILRTKATELHSVISESYFRVETGSNTSIVAQRVVRCD
jgi:hypothetical protein